MLVATAAVYSTTSATAQIYCANPLYLDVTGEDVDACGTEEAPCATLDYVANRALTCSIELGEEITILQMVDEGNIAVGLANASGLAEAPLAVDITESTAESLEAEAATEEEPAGELDAEEIIGDEAEAEELALAEEAAPEAEAVEAGTELEEAEAAEEADAGWIASRDNAFYSILALLLGAVMGVVMGYGSRSGAGTAAAILVAAGVALAPTVAHAQERCPGEYAFYSSESGENGETCGPPEQPCQTFEYVLMQASACLHGVTIYEDGIPVFTLELSSSLTEVGDQTVSEIGESAVNIDVADEVDTGGAVEEEAEEAVVEIAESVADVPEAAGDLVEVAETPVAADLDWVWLIGMIALGTVLGYAAHALPAAKIE